LDGGQDNFRLHVEDTALQPNRWDPDNIPRTVGLRWTGHVARTPLTRAPREILTNFVDNPRPFGCPQMNWGRTLEKALQSYGLPTEFAKWREMAADRNQWRAICASNMLSATKETPKSSRQDS
jgi:hypothetical protein